MNVGVEDAVRRADACLYAAKAQGRNRVVLELLDVDTEHEAPAGEGGAGGVAPPTIDERASLAALRDG